MPSKEKNRVLVVAAHPDDEVLGCGGTIAQMAAQGEVHIAILGEGISARYSQRGEVSSSELETLQQQACEAARILGARSVKFGQLPDNRFDELPLLDVVKIVEQWVKEFQPNIIYTHHPGDLNVDHVITFRAVLTATRPVPECPVRQIYSFEIPSSTEWAFQRLEPSFRPNVFVDISETIQTKILALSQYAGEIRPFPHPRSSKTLEVIAQRWGSVAGMQCAEAFELIRTITRNGDRASNAGAGAQPMKVFYLGGKQAGCVGLLTLYSAGCQILGAVAYDPYIRNLVKTLGLPLFESIQENSVQELLRQSDLLVCVHGREFVHQELLRLPRDGAINVHPCLYAYKGARPIERWLQDGNTKASVGIHRMGEKIDEGEVLVEEFMEIREKLSVREVYNSLYPLYATTLLQALQKVRLEKK